MKVLRLFVSSLALTFVLTGLAIAQTEKPQPVNQGKVAMIDENTLYDEDEGIKQLARVENSLKMEFIESYQTASILSLKIETLEKEIYCLQSQSKSVQDKVNELQKLKDEQKRIINELKANYERRKTELVNPVFEKVREKLKAFCKQKGYKICVVKSSIFELSMITEGEITDITSEFVQFCNNSFEKAQ